MHCAFLEKGTFQFEIKLLNSNTTNLSLVGELGVLSGFLLTLKENVYVYLGPFHSTLIYLFGFELLFPLPINCPLAWVGAAPFPPQPVAAEKKNH